MYSTLQNIIEFLLKIFNLLNLCHSKFLEKVNLKLTITLIFNQDYISVQITLKPFDQSPLCLTPHEIGKISFVDKFDVNLDYFLFE